MKITSSRRDEILKQKAEYEADRAARQAKYDEQQHRFYQAEYDVTSLVEDEIKSQLDRFGALQFDVSVTRGKWGNSGLYVRIECNEHNKFEEDVALSWSYQVNLTKDGEVQKESSSWSGLKATTEAQIESLTQTLDALKYLNRVDWATVLNKEMPNYRDYFTEDDPRYDRDTPNFDQMLMEADIEESIGKDVLLKGYASINQRGYGVGSAYYMILKETPAQYTVCRIPGYVVNNEEYDLKDVVEKNKRFAERMRKDKLIQLLNKPIETLEV